jgi:hypothetical protein
MECGPYELSCNSDNRNRATGSGGGEVGERWRAETRACSSGRLAPVRNAGSLPLLFFIIKLVFLGVWLCPIWPPKASAHYCGEG